MIQIIEKFATKCPCWSTNLYQQSLVPEKRSSNYQAYYSCKPKLMLHSVGCARASADVQAERWNSETNNNAIAHAVIDSNDGLARQTLRWDMRGWHCGNPGNNSHIGVEMCESDAIAYDQPKAWQFTVKNRAKAEAHCRTAYNGSVELFAYLCKLYGLDPLTDICSHKEGHDAGIASNHGDPEHYWSGMGMPYTMDGFRADVKAAMEATGFLGFPDVSEDDWYADALRRAVEKKVVLPSGKPFHPEIPLDKATAIVLLMRIFNALDK